MVEDWDGLQLDASQVESLETSLVTSVFPRFWCWPANQEHGTVCDLPVLLSFISTRWVTRSRDISSPQSFYLINLLIVSVLTHV
jgi:hypothetical protein